jgi:hypothetical protein
MQLPKRAPLRVFCSGRQLGRCVAPAYGSGGRCRVVGRLLARFGCIKRYKSSPRHLLARRPAEP